MMTDEKLAMATVRNKDSLVWATAKEYFDLLDWRRTGIEEAREAIRGVRIRDCVSGNGTGSRGHMLKSLLDQFNPFHALAESFTELS